MRSEAFDIFLAGLRAGDPYKAVLEHAGLKGDTLFAGGHRYDIKRFKKIIAVGAGKAAYRMGMAVEEVFGDRLEKGILITKYGHGGKLKRLKLIEASHPLPDEAGVNGTEEIIELLKEADEITLVVCLLSGGASSLLVKPADGITLDEKGKTVELLLKGGADIYELNTVRKHISGIKGGRLLSCSYPAKVISFIMSDVIGDRLDVIASGPTAPDGTTFGDGRKVFEKFGIWDNIPESVRAHMEKGEAGEIPETPKGSEPFFKNADNIIVGSLRQSLLSSRDKAASMGFETVITDLSLSGEARGAAGRLAERATREQKKGGGPKCLISGGETFVTVKGKGLGGRNQELALAFAIDIEGLEGITLLSAGTDGTDGPTDADGAIVDGKTAGEARRFGIDPEAYLNENDSYNFFARLDSLSGSRHHIKTGPTGTNVLDIQVIIINKEGNTV